MRSTVAQKRIFEGTISVHQDHLGRGENFCLKVKGVSMTGDGILDGDIVIINRQTVAVNNEMVAILINNEEALKRFCKTEDGVKLRPSNPLMEPTMVRSVMSIHWKLLSSLLENINAYGFNGIKFVVGRSIIIFELNKLKSGTAVVRFYVFHQPPYLDYVLHFSSKWCK